MIKNRTDYSFHSDDHRMAGNKNQKQVLNTAMKGKKLYICTGWQAHRRRPHTEVSLLLDF